MSKTCNTCQQEKLFEEFSKSNSGRHGYCNTCRQCRKSKRKTLNYTAPAEGTKNCNDCKKELSVICFYKDKSNSTGLQSYCKECSVAHTKKWASSYDGYCKRLLQGIKQNLKKRSKNLECSLRLEDIKSLYDSQKGFCALSGMKMTFDTYMRKDEQHIINKYNMSVDRIDSTKGYSKENIQLVCAIVNRMKSDLQDAEFIQLCGIITRYNSELPL